MESFTFDYYLSLLQVQMAILGIVVAGLVTLMQLLNNATPKRQVKMLAGPLELGGFVVFLGILLCTLATATWAMAFTTSTAVLFVFFSNQFVGLGLLAASLLGLLWFMYLIYRTRQLLNPQLYLGRYVAATPASAVHTYVEMVYQARAAKHASTYAASNNFRETHDFRDRLEYVDRLYDPFQPIREYVKHNAQQQFDYGTASGLRLFGKLFDKAFTAVPKAEPQTATYLAEHLAASGVEFFKLFNKLGSEKRKLDVIRLLYAKGCLFLDARNDTVVLVIVRALEEMGEASQSETEIVTIVECVQDLTNSYLALHSKESWDEIGAVFEEICLSMGRLAESYYLNANQPLRSVPIVGYYTGRTRDVSVSFVNFFMGYRKLAAPRIEAYPKLYFEAVEALCEALHARISELNETGKGSIGLNRNYHTLTNRLYKIFDGFALEAVEHHRADLFALSVSNLRRIMASAHTFNLGKERQAVAKILLSLAAARSASAMTDMHIKGRPMADYVVEVLEGKATKDELEAAFSKIPKTHQTDVMGAIKERLLQ